MADNLKPDDRRKTMRAVKGKGTKPERQLCSMLAGMGLTGWKRNAGDVIGKPDVVFSNERIAIFVDGCFWHGCPHCQRKLPVTNREYWQRKINRNAELGRVNSKKLRDRGWIVIRIWEHEIRDTSERKRIRNEIRQAIHKDADQ